jgi:hypothetical protein
MRTEELIRVLAADGSRPVMPIGSALLRALALGAVLSLALFLLVLRPRPDLGQALFTLPFVFKLAVTLGLAAAALRFLPDAARPVSSYRYGWPLMLVPMLLAVGVAAELTTLSSEDWATRLMGRNAPHCLALIPLLSLPSLVCLLAVLRRGAPAHPWLAGAAAGLTASGVGALLYAIACPDDSPLFIATWYSISIAIVTLASARVGGRLLRW